MSVNNASLSCDNDLQTFRQHSGECWNDAIQNFLLVSSGIGENVRAQLRSADAVATFSAWLTSEEIQAWLQEEFHIDPDLLPVFNRLAISYIECFKERIDNWRDKRQVGNLPRHRRASCVFSQCSASAGMYASELLWPPAELPPRKRVLLKPNILNKLRNGTIDPLRAARENREAERVQKGYNIWWAARFIRLLLYYFLKEDTYKRVASLDGVYIEALTQKMLMISEPHLKVTDIAKIYNTMKKTHSINFLASGKNPMDDSYHQIHLVSCDTASRNQYIYDNNVSLIKKVRWANIFDEDATTYYISWYDGPFNKSIFEQVLLRLFSGQAFVTGGKRTNEQMRENFLKEGRRVSENPLQDLRMKFFANIMTYIDLSTEEERKREFFKEMKIDLSKQAGTLRDEILKDIRDFYDDSILIKMLVEFKPLLVIFKEEKYYFFNSTGYRVISDEQIVDDVIAVAGALFCEGSLEKFFMVLCAAISSITGSYNITDAELVWMVPTKVKNVNFNRTMRNNNKNKNRTRRRN
jgi:hypothetical protein